MAAITSFTVGGTEVAVPHLRDQSSVIEKRANGRGTIECTLVDPESIYRPSLRAVVHLEVDEVPVFGGIVWDHTENAIGDPTTGIAGRVLIVDYTALTDKVLLNGTVPAGTLQSQLEFVFTNMIPHGLSVSPDQQPGPTLPAQGYNFETIKTILEDLSLQASLFGVGPGYVWMINHAGQLLMDQFGAFDAPTDIREDTGNYRLISWTRSLNDYINEVWVVYGPQGAVAITEIFTGDGVGDTFALGHTLVLTGTGVTPNNLVQVVIGAVPANNTIDADTGGAAQWHYDVTINSIIRDAGALGAGDTVSITYQANSPGVVFERDQDEYDTYGPFTGRFDAPGVLTLAAATTYAQGLLRRLSGIVRRVTVVTDQAGFEPLQIVHVDVPSRDLVGEFLVVSVRMIEEVVLPPEGAVLDSGDRSYVFELELLEGNQWRANWEPFWRPERGALTGGTTTIPGATPNPPPTFPIPIGRASGNNGSTNQITHAINLPAHQAGDTLVVFFSAGFGGTSAVNGTFSTLPWTQLAQLSNSITCHQAIYTKVATTNAENLVIDLSTADQSTHISYCIRYAGAVTATQITTTGNNSDPPNHTPGFNDNYLWLAVRSVFGTAFTPSAAPTDFSNLLTETGGSSSAMTSVAERLLAANALNPTVFTSGGGGGAVGIVTTVAVRAV